MSEVPLYAQAGSLELSGAHCPIDLIRTSIRNKHSGSMIIAKRLNYISHSNAKTGSNWSNR